MTRGTTGCVTLLDRMIVTSSLLLGSHNGELGCELVLGGGLLSSLGIGLSGESSSSSRRLPGNSCSGLYLVCVISSSSRRVQWCGQLGMVLK